MKRISRWFSDLKIRQKLFAEVVAIVMGLIILMALSNLIYRTFSVFTMMKDVERIHTMQFHSGIDDFQLFRLTGNVSFYHSAVQKVERANQLLLPFVATDSVIRVIGKTGLEHMFVNHYGEVLNDEKTIRLMADRIYMFRRLQIRGIEEMFSIARSGLAVGRDILTNIKKYKETGDASLLQNIQAGLKKMELFSSSWANRININTSTGLQVVFYFNIILAFILALINYFIVRKISSAISKPINQLMESFRETEKGNFKLRLSQRSNDELGMLVRSFNKVQESLEANDNRIKKDLWLRNGLEGVNKIINSDIDVKEMAEKVLSYIVNYLDGFAGTLYFKNENRMELLASYGLDKKRLMPHLEKGKGMAGQVLKDLKPLLLKDRGKQGFKTFTSTGEVYASTVYILPMFSKEKEPVALLELASLNDFDKNGVDWLQIVSQPVVTALQVAMSHKKILALLEETQQQAEELETQQEELRAANAELEEQTVQLKENEKKLQQQQEELRVSNEELEERTHDLEIQRQEVLKKNRDLEQVKEALKKKAEQLEITGKYKSEFLANMSHELRTPLNSMLILSKDLANNKKGNLTPEQMESAKIIYSAGTDLLHLINDILDLSKIESGKMQVNPEHTELAEIVRGMEKIFDRVAQERNIYFKAVVEEGTPRELYTDRQRLDQIIKNLISNAMKFTRKGGVTLRFRASNNISQENETQTVICVDVEDTGIGIPEEKQQAIFEAFQQADGSISRKFGGTGLGLSISKQLAHMLGGNISLKSELGKGSVFTVCIPVKYPGEQPVDGKNRNETAANNGVSEDGEASEQQPGQLENRVDRQVMPSEPMPRKEFIKDDREQMSDADNKILIIEDDANFAAILMKHCHNSGFKCIVTPTGEEGLKLAEQYKPDAISLDIKLPGMDGHTVLKLLKENPLTRHIPVQILSALSEQEAATDRAAFTFLKKPVSGEQIDSVLQRIKNYVNREVKDLLIVEDDPNTQKTLKGLLASKQVKITAVSTGSEALSLLKGRRYDGIILDLGLKDMSGFELIKKLNAGQDKAESCPPIIVYTGRELTKEEMKELNRSVCSIIVKGERSEERLLDETALFLHQVVDNMDEDKRQIIRKLHDADVVFRGKKILLVDDDMRNVFALTSVLNDHNLEVIEAENGLVALERLKEMPDIDLVLMDVMMPEMDGLTATVKIREMPQFESLPVIVLTAKAMKEDKEKALKAGANDYLTKPVNVEKLLSLIRVWLYK